MFSFIKSPATLKSGSLAYALLGITTLWISNTEAALTISSTRVIYDSDQKNVSLRVANPSSKPFAVQTWVNTLSDDQTTAVPFTASPPLFRLNAGKEQQVQINGLPHSLPQDRESLFFLMFKKYRNLKAVSLTS